MYGFNILVVVTDIEDVFDVFCLNEFQTSVIVNMRTRLTG